jgi:hypothetical protein
VLNARAAPALAMRLCFWLMTPGRPFLSSLAAKRTFSILFFFDFGLFFFC